MSFNAFSSCACQQRKQELLLMFSTQESALCSTLLTPISSHGIGTVGYVLSARVVLLLLLFFGDPGRLVLNSQGMKKIRYAIQKSAKIKLE